MNIYLIVFLMEDMFHVHKNCTQETRGAQSVIVAKEIKGKASKLTYYQDTIWENVVVFLSTKLLDI